MFYETGGMYPELITRPDLKVFLPPIGGISFYILGNPDFISDPTKKLTLRVHDECNGTHIKISFLSVIFFYLFDRCLHGLLNLLIL
jgi:hypothetical protein